MRRSHVLSSSRNKGKEDKNITLHMVQWKSSNDKANPDTSGFDGNHDDDDE